MSDRMTRAEEIREADRREDARFDRTMEKAEAEGRITRCPIHGGYLVAGVGIGKELHVFPEGGGCAECFYQTEEYRAMAARA